MVSISSRCPGHSKESIPRFIECSQHPEKIRYKHAALEPILGVTYGCMVYQEQVQQVFRELAGYSLGQADILRRLYSIWFSHKDMEQIIYWNTVDGYAHAAEPGDMSAGENYYRGGLIRFDFTKKPAYNMLKKLIHEEWHTETSSVSKNGVGKFKGFYGDYELTVKTASGEVRKTVHLGKNCKNDFEIII